MGFRPDIAKPGWLRNQVILVIVYVINHLLIFMALTQTSITLESLSGVCNNISFIVGGVIVITRLVLNWKRRVFMNTFLQNLNKKFKEAVLLADDQQMKEYNRQFLFLTHLLAMLIMGTLAISGPIFFIPVVTGKRLMNLYLPDGVNAYDKSWWLSVVYSTVTSIYAALYYAFNDTQLMDCGFQLAFVHRIQYKLVRDSKLRDKHALTPIIKELQEFQKLTADYLFIIWPYQFLLWTCGYFMLGMSAVCAVIELRNGFVAMIVVLAYPVYVFCVLALWSFIGTYYEDSVRTML